MLTPSEDKMNDGIALLGDPQSSNRRSGAKQLRRLRDQHAGPALLDALKNEITDPRTWETQYQMIAAIGECDFREALPYLRELAGQTHETTMIYVAIGDALLRLSRKSENDAEILLDLIPTNNPNLIMGSLQAVAMLRMGPSDNIISEAISYALAAYTRTAYIKGGVDWSIIWVLRAAPGWHGTAVDQFLHRCAKISFEQNQQIHTATQLALTKKYEKWSPA
jgi:hypothetical protein